MDDGPGPMIGFFLFMTWGDRGSMVVLRKEERKKGRGGGGEEEVVRLCLILYLGVEGVVRYHRCGVVSDRGRDSHWD